MRLRVGNNLVNIILSLPTFSIEKGKFISGIGRGSSPADLI